MKFPDLITPIEKQSDEELSERLRQIRHNRERARPVATKKAAKVTRKESARKMTSTEKLLASLSQEERDALIKKLEST